MLSCKNHESRGQDHKSIMIRQNTNSALYIHKTQHRMLKERAEERKSIVAIAIAILPTTAHMEGTLDG